MNLILVRHGETEENVARIVQGQMPGKLSASGVLQSKELALALKGEHFDAVFCSDLQRCIDTAAEIMQFHKNTQITYTKALREINFGSLQGQYSKDIAWHFTDNIDGTLVFGGGESNMQLAARVISFVNSLLPKYSNKKLLFVTHGGPMRAIQASSGNKHFGELYRTIVPNAEPMTFSIVEELSLPSY